MNNERWQIRYRDPEHNPDTPLDVNREAQIRQLHEDLGRETSLAATGTRAAIGDLLNEISRLRRLLHAHDIDPDSAPGGEPR